MYGLLNKKTTFNSIDLIDTKRQLNDKKCFTDLVQIQG